MIKRLQIYFREMYPLIPRLFLGFLLFFEVYFLVILTYGITRWQVGIQEVIGSVTVFFFLMSLRIADDFKDEEADKLLFPHRPLPSGRVTKKDLQILLSIMLMFMIPLNLLLMGNQIFFIVLVLYGLLMSFWFFQKHRIQKNLILALITHNPVQIILNIYIISFACAKYQIPLVSFNNAAIAVTLYFPGLIWEVGRKIRAPEEETEYTTYSKLFGLKKATRFILAVMLVDLFSTSFLVWQLYWWAPITVLACYLWLVYQSERFIRRPSRFQLITKIEQYEYVAEVSVVLFIAAYLISLR